jgi:cell division septation protein DedD
MLLTILGLGLVAVCAVCFISGYAMGRHATPDGGQTVAAKDAPSAEQLFSQQPKPSAAPVSQQPKSDEAALDAVPDGAASTDTAGTDTQTAAVVPAALPAQGGAAQPAAASQQVHAALPQSNAGTGLWMVQIALTPNQKDADLMAADLRAKGINVLLRRDGSSGLIYVQTGPFATREDAAAMRQKVVASGYNAIIQP